jgi:branched-chain amino acid transport system substrate-binding protein
MKRFSKSMMAFVAAAVAAVCFAVGAVAQEKEVMIGGQCDRTGPTQIVGVVYCPAIQDYIDLVNSKGGVEGYKIKITSWTTNTKCRRRSKNTSARSRQAPYRW